MLDKINILVLKIMNKSSDIHFHLPFYLCKNQGMIINE